MASKKILALSSSRVGNGGYLEMGAPLIKEFLGDRELKIAFVPFASVAVDHEQYGHMVVQGLDIPKYRIELVTKENAAKLITAADVIMVGGGNTFKLLHNLYEFGVLPLIRERVVSGIPYIGWSAGANITGLTISTTNDMPIIQPPSFKAFGFFPFQINPHYTNYSIPGHNGETRDQRLEEFMQLNKGVDVVCLPEGTALRLINDKIEYVGKEQGVMFVKAKDHHPIKTILDPGQALSL